MHTTAELFDAVKARQGLTSDYKLAKVLGLTTAAISIVRKRNGSVSDATAIKIADLAGMSRDYCVACAHAHRATSGDVRHVWESIAKKAAGAVALILVGSFCPPSHATQGDAPLKLTNNIHYTKLRRLARLVDAFIGWRISPIPA